jgi:redox-sensitive bicupin YhaK (pirin superfamily)
MTIRAAKKISVATPTLEGAGVKLHRAFGFGDTSATDPFLLLDDFRNDRAEDYVAGFPWHPHRGIETITYVLAGTVEHQDSLGNHGNLGAGDIQWMTAGRGILHQEMPQGDERSRMHGFQLWANLPAAHKMDAPRYQDIAAAEIPVVRDDSGIVVRVISGSFWGATGPVTGVAAQPTYLDVSVPANCTALLPVDTHAQAFAYIFEGSGCFRDASAPIGVLTEKTDDQGHEFLQRETTGNRSLVLFSSGDEVVVQAANQGLRFLLVSGRPICEPIAWHGPIVMNTDREIQQAMHDLQQGTFIQ